MNSEKLTIAGGCFWCVEALFTRLKGVENVIPGYAGGNVESPTYELVSSGTTGYAESIQITFDSTIIPLRVLLEIFFRTHDPTTVNRQGADVGTQYRSAIFYTTDDQRETALAVIQKLQSEHVFKSPIVTEIVPFTNFYEAEDYHKRYYDTNSYQPYCNIVIDPKVHKLITQFGDRVKEEYKRI